MPVYDFECAACDGILERLVGYEERDEQCCPECGARLQRLPAVPQLNTAACRMDTYYDETLGAEIHTERQRRYLMEQKGLTDYEPDSDTKKIRDEMRYVRKATGDERAVKHVGNTMGAEAAKRHRHENVKEKVAKAFKEM